MSFHYTIIYNLTHFYILPYLRRFGTVLFVFPLFVRKVNLSDDYQSSKLATTFLFVISIAPTRFLPKTPLLAQGADILALGHRGRLGTMRPLISSLKGIVNAFSNGQLVPLIPLHIRPTYKTTPTQKGKRCFVAQEEGFSPLAARPGGRLSIVQVGNNFSFYHLYRANSFSPENASHPLIPLHIRRTYKTTPTQKGKRCFVAQEEGFEPPWAFTQTVFKTASL